MAKKQTTSKTTAQSDGGYTAFKAKHFPQVGSGTFAAQRCLARWESVRLLATANSEPQPDLRRLYLAVRDAVDQAICIVKFSRSESEVLPQAVIGAFVRLAENLDHATAFSQAPGLLDTWPKDPGITLGLKAGWSALDVGFRFATSILAGSRIGGQIGAQKFAAEVERCLVDPPDSLAIRWGRGVLKELRELTIPPKHVWPVMGPIHRDGDSFQYKLLDEYECAVAAVTSSDPQDRARRRHPAIDTTSQREPNIFQLRRKFWVVRYEGVEAVLPKQLGHQYLERLLTQPNQHIEVSQLVGLGALGVALAAGQSDPIADKAALKSYYEDLKELDGQIDDADSDHNEALKDQLIEQRDEMRDHLKSVKGLGGQSRINTSVREKMRISVSRAIDRALAAIKAEHVKLYDHLAGSIRKGACCSYAPSTPTFWGF